jgi:hypothetical protein
LNRSARLLGIVLALAAPPAPAGGNPPQIDFMLHCQGCHLSEGQGLAGQVPRLKGEVGKFLHSDEGRAFLLRVPGVAQSSLNDADLAAVMNWVLEEFDPEHLPPAFEPYTAAEVAQWRTRIMRNVNAERTRILEAAGFAARDR